MAYSLWLMAYGKNYRPISQDATARPDRAVWSERSERAIGQRANAVSERETYVSS